MAGGRGMGDREKDIKSIKTILTEPAQLPGDRLVALGLLAVALSIQELAECLKTKSS
jgi:hypothetical protein